MPYEKQGFVNGKVLRAEQLIAIEEALIALEKNQLPEGGKEGQVPTKTATGTIVWADPPEGNGDSIPSAEGVAF